MRAAVVVGVAFLTFGTVARAEPQTFVSLDYEVAPDAIGCLDEAEFRTSVQRQLGYDPFRPDADRRVGVQIGRKETHFSGRIRWTDARGSWVGDRRLSSRQADCSEIAASLAFSVAVQVQLLATLAPPAAEPVAPPPPPPPPQPAPPLARPEVVVRATAAAPTGPSTTVTATAAVEPKSPRANRVALSVGAGPSLALHVAPQPTALARLFVSGRVSRFSLEVAVDGALPTDQRAADGSGFSLYRFGAATAACGHARAFAACLTATLGVFGARGFGLDAPAKPTGLFSQVGARIAATSNLGERFFAAARVDGLVMLSPWTVTVNQVATWVTPRVGALIGLDLGARFF